MTGFGFWVGGFADGNTVTTTNVLVVDAFLVSGSTNSEGVEVLPGALRRGVANRLGWGVGVVCPRPDQGHRPLAGAVPVL